MVALRLLVFLKIKPHNPLAKHTGIVPTLCRFKTRVYLKGFAQNSGKIGGELYMESAGEAPTMFGLDLGSQADNNHPNGCFKVFFKIRPKFLKGLLLINFEECLIRCLSRPETGGH